MLYQKIIRPWFFRMDAETAHNTVFNRMIKLQRSDAFLKLVNDLVAVEDERLNVFTSGLRFPNPVGLAAGFDKNGLLLPSLSAAGFGFIETGSITARPTAGNPKPRMFRLPADQALINRMGLNNEGADAIAKRLGIRNLSLPVGANIAKTPGLHKDTASSIQDYVYSFRKVMPVSDYITLNISCPNTGDGKSFEDPELFRLLLDEVLSYRSAEVPVFVKFSADTTDENLEKLLQIAEEFEIDGYVAVNTSVSRKGLQTADELLQNIGAGGLSGAPLKSLGAERVSFIRNRIQPEKTLISAGGISNGMDALQRLENGANLIQIYTALVYEGPQLAGLINRYLLEHADQSTLTGMSNS